MSGVLTLHDVSGYVHTGMHTDEFSSFTYQGLPMGGIKYFLRHFGVQLSGMSDFSYFFDSGSFRKSLMPGYKAGRISNPAINMQLDILYDVLLRCGVPCYKEDGFEADDIIFSAVEQNKGVYNKMKVFSADNDLTHNVDMDVSFEAINSNVNSMNYHTFSNAVVKGEMIPLNTISAHKVFNGCKSDKIPPFKSLTGIKASEFFNMFKEFLDKISGGKYLEPSITRKRELLLLFFKEELLDKLPKEEVEDLILRSEIVYPKKVEGVTFKGANRTNFTQSQKLEMATILSICGEYRTLNFLNHSKVTPSEKQIKFFANKASELRTGAFAANRGLTLEDPVVESSMMDMRDFV